jgi:hypothetical protein
MDICICSLNKYPNYSTQPILSQALDIQQSYSIDSKKSLIPREPRRTSLLPTLEPPKLAVAITISLLPRALALSSLAGGSGRSGLGSSIRALALPVLSPALALSVAVLSTALGWRRRGSGFRSRRGAGTLRGRGTRRRSGSGDGRSCALSLGVFCDHVVAAFADCELCET